MSDDDEPAPYDDDPLAENVASTAAKVRAAFRGESALSRGTFLAVFRSDTAVDGWKESIEAACAEDPDATREEVVEHVREQQMGFYARAAAAAGLGDLETWSFLGAVRRGLDLAASGGEGKPVPMPLVEPDPALQAEKALEVRAAFDRTPAEIADWLDALYRDLVSRVATDRLVDYADDPIRYEVVKQSFMAGLLRLAVDAKLGDAEAEVYTETVRRAFADAGRERPTKGGE